MRGETNIAAFREKYRQYFRDTDVYEVDDTSFVFRVLEKGSLEDISALYDVYGRSRVRDILIEKIDSEFHQLSPALIHFFTLCYQLPDAVSKRAMTTAKANDFVYR